MTWNLILFRNILWPQQMFPGLRNIETPFILCRVRLRGQERSSTTMCPRLPEL